MRDYALKYCQAAAEAEAPDAETYRLAREKIAELFGLSPEAQELLEAASSMSWESSRHITEKCLPSSWT